MDFDVTAAPPLAAPERPQTPPEAPAAPTAAPAVDTRDTTPDEPARAQPTDETAAHARLRTAHDPAANQLRARLDAATPPSAENLPDDKRFQALPEASRTRAQELLGRLDENPAARATLSRAVTTPGFEKLKPESQERLMTLIGGKNDDLSGPARTALGRELDRSARLPADQQAQRLERFLTQQPYLPELVSGEGQPIGGPARFGPTTRDPRAPFDNGRAPGQRGDVDIDMSRTPVVTPERSAHKRWPAITREEMGTALRGLPDTARRSISEMWADPRMEDKGKTYAQADEDTRRIDVFPGPLARGPGALGSTVNHEAGHTLSFQRLGKDLDNPAGQAYREAIQRDRLAPSTYGRESAHEDFAETFALYLKHRGTPMEREVRELFPARMKVIDWAIQSDPTGVVEHGGYR